MAAMYMDDCHPVCWSSPGWPGLVLNKGARIVVTLCVAGFHSSLCAAFCGHYPWDLVGSSDDSCSGLNPCGQASSRLLASIGGHFPIGHGQWSHSVA